MGRPAQEGPVPLGAVAPRGALAAIVVVAAVVRLVWLRQDSTFQRSDEVMFVLNALRLDAIRGAGPGAAARELFWMLAFPWGYPVLLLLYGVMTVYGWLGVAVTEFSLVAPFALIGALSPLLVYLLARRAFATPIALLAALAVALLPSHVAQSRTIASWLLASNLMMLALLALWRYLDTGRRRDAALFGAALAAYLPSDNLAPGTLVVLTAVVFFWTSGSLADRVRATLAVCLRPAVVLLPLLSLAVLVAVQAVFVAAGRPTYGFLGHYLAGKVAHGVHIAPLVAGVWSNTAPAIALLAAAGVVRAPLSLTAPGREWVFLCWLLGFLVPTVLLINPRGTVLQAYLTPIIVPLLVLGAAGLVTAVRRVPLGRRALVAIAVGFLAFAVATLPPRVYGRDLLGVPARPIGLWGGEQYPNNGVKTAGYWIRTRTSPSAVVLSDVRLFVGKYYFHRPTIAPGDPRFDPSGFARVRERVEVVAATAAWTERPEAGAYLDGYHRVLTVTHGGRPVFYVYTRAARTPEVWRSEDGDPRFDREFGRPHRLRYPFVWEDDLPPLSG